LAKVSVMVSKMVFHDGLAFLLGQMGDLRQFLDEVSLRHRQRRQGLP
jgi:hypothetical protein